MTIETIRLRLQLQSRDKLLAMWTDVPEVSPDWLARVRASAEPDPFLFGYAVVDRESNSLIGHAGFKGPPGKDEIVEIAYGTEPEYQGRGYATEIAEALVGYAQSSGRVRLVRAHTLPTNDASMRVLEKCGFTRVGEVVDPENGLLWRWELICDYSVTCAAV